MSWIDEQYENIAGQYVVTSNPDVEYNCIAYAAGKTDEWWQHGPGYIWPTSHRSPLINSLVAAFEALNYVQCPTGVLEPAYEKVALYERNGLWKHAARQLRSGKWTSKLGPEEDIQHDTPQSICGTKYGTIHCYMRRPIP